VGQRKEAFSPVSGVHEAPFLRCRQRGWSLRLRLRERTRGRSVMTGWVSCVPS